MCKIKGKKSRGNQKNLLNLSKCNLLKASQRNILLGVTEKGSQKCNSNNKCNIRAFFYLRIF